MGTSLNVYGREQIFRYLKGIRFVGAKPEVLLSEKTNTSTETCLQMEIGTEESDFPIKPVLLDINISVFVPSAGLPKILHATFVSSVGVFMYLHTYKRT